MDLSGLGNIIIVLFLSYYSFYLIKLLRKKNRDLIKSENIELDKMRKIPIKTLDEQKKFINMKYPKTGKFKFSWRMVYDIIIFIIIFSIFTQIYYFLIKLTGIVVPLWIAIIFVMIMPIILNIILSRFNLEQKGDLHHMFKK